jgi:hypothetical protein
MQEVVQQLEQLLARAKNYCDQPNDERARRLQQAVQAVLGEAKQGKKPEYLVEKIRAVARMTEVFKNQDDVYDFRHTDDLHDRCQDIEKMLRKLAG